MDEAGKLLIGKGEQPQYLQLPLANRHGLIAGATGTGKTITLQVLAEQFSRAGVPVFCADVKGDLSGIAEAGDAQAQDRAARGRARRHRLRLCRGAGDLLGPVRRAGPSDPRHGGRDGAAAARAHAGAQRDPGGRAQHRLQARRRPGPAAARLQGPDRDPAGRGRERGRADHRLRQCQQGHDRHHPAPPAHAGAAGGRALLRRAGAGARRPDADHAGRARGGQRAGGRQADPLAPALRHLPALAAVGAVRGAAGGGRPRQAQARLLLRRGAPAVQRRAQGADREGRAGGAPDPLQGGRRLLRHPEPGRRAAGDPGPARQPGAARAARLHAGRAEGDQGRGRDLPPQPGLQDRRR